MQLVFMIQDLVVDVLNIMIMQLLVDDWPERIWLVLVSPANGNMQHQHSAFNSCYFDRFLSIGKPYKHQSMFWSDLGPKVGYEALGINKFSNFFINNLLKIGFFPHHFRYHRFNIANSQCIC